MDVEYLVVAGFVAIISARAVSLQRAQIDTPQWHTMSIRADVRVGIGSGFEFSLYVNVILNKTKPNAH